MKTLEVLYDGEVFRPERKPDLEANRRYVITVAEPHTERAGSICDVLEKLAGTVDAPEDWAEEHDHYLYGAAKRTGHQRSR